MGGDNAVDYEAASAGRISTSPYLEGQIMARRNVEMVFVGVEEHDQYVQLDFVDWYSRSLDFIIRGK